MFNSLISSIISKNIKKKIDKWTIKESDVKPILEQIKVSFIDADVNVKAVDKIITNTQKKLVGTIIDQNVDPSNTIITKIKEEIVNILGVKTSNINLSHSITKIILVGLQGSGKTTTCAKLALYLKNKFYKRPLIVACDVYRPAAIEQLKQLATENKIDFFSNDSNNPIEIAGNAELFALKNNNDVIIYDTAGRLQTDKKLMNELTNMQNKIHPHEIFFIADAFAGQNIYDVAKEFNNNINLTGLIITKLDSEARGGASLSLAYLLEIPIKFSGTGEKIGSLEVFHPERVANRILGLGDMVTLAEKIEENVDQQTIKKTFARMLSGKMDLEDLLVQMQQLTKVGSFDSILKMMPNAQKLDENQILEVEEKIRKWKIIMQSMTKKERRNPILFKKQPDRKIRVINGSGRKPDELNKMLSEWEKAKKRMDEMGEIIKRGKNPFSTLF